MRLKATCVGLLMLCGAFQAHAALSAANYKAMKASHPAQAQMYVRGVGEGISWTNTLSIQEGNKPLYCPPPQMALGLDNYLYILDRAIEQIEAGRQQSVPTRSIEAMLLFGLIETFPCD